MDVIDAVDALIAHIKAMPGRPAIHYPDGPQTNDLPRIVIQIPTAPQRRIALTGETEGDAVIVARIETEAGDLGETAKSIAKAVIAHFHPLTVALNGVTIIQPPQRGGQYHSGGIMHTPITITGRFFTD